jgi:hypothetical protein
MALRSSARGVDTHAGEESQGKAAAISGHKNRIAMDALTLLRDVSDAYRALQSLSVEATISTDSGDENSSQQSEQRVRFFYAAPDQIRYETGVKISPSQEAMKPSFIKGSNDA